MLYGDCVKEKKVLAPKPTSTLTLAFSRAWTGHLYFSLHFHWFTMSVTLVLIGCNFCHKKKSQPIFVVVGEKQSCRSLSTVIFRAPFKIFERTLHAFSNKTFSLRS